jgi:hypothetical protein
VKDDESFLCINVLVCESVPFFSNKDKKLLAIFTGPIHYYMQQKKRLHFSLSHSCELGRRSSKWKHIFVEKYEKKSLITHHWPERSYILADLL